jgi:hypothetical protein
MSLAELAKRARENRGKSGAKPVAKTDKKPVGINRTNYEFDYNINRINVEKFAQAKLFLTQDIGEHYGEVSTIIERGHEHEFHAPDHPTQEEWNDPETGFLTQVQYKSDVSEHAKSRYNYESKRTQAWHFILSKCTTSMKNAIKQDPEWTNWERNKNTLQLWLRIVDVSMNGTGVPEDEDKKINEARFKFDRVFQRSTESVGEFYERFNILYSAMVNQGARLYQIFLPEDLDAEALIEQRAAAAVREDRMKALSFLQKLDKARFGGLIDELENALERGRNEYPNTLVDAYAMACRYKQNGVLVDGLLKPRADQYHAAMTAPAKAESKEPAARKGPVCWTCDAPGHVQKDCPLHKKVIDYYKKASKNSKEVKEELRKQFSFVSIGKAVQKFAMVEKDKRPFSENDVLLDNEASVSVFNNKNLLTNIRKATYPVTVNGVGKGEIVTDMVGDFLCFGEVYYHPECIANILCFYDVNKSFGVKFKRGQFTVYLPSISKTLVFKPRSKLYVCDISKLIDDLRVDKHVSEVNSVMSLAANEHNPVEDSSSFIIDMNLPAVTETPTGDYTSATIGNDETTHTSSESSIEIIHEGLSLNSGDSTVCLQVDTEFTVSVPVHREDYTLKNVKIAEKEGFDLKNFDVMKSYLDIPIPQYVPDMGKPAKTFSDSVYAKNSSSENGHHGCIMRENVCLQKEKSIFSDENSAISQSLADISLKKDTNDGINGPECVLVETVERNLLKFTKKQVKMAEEAKRLYSVLGRPSFKDFISMIKEGRIMNCPITVDDIHRAVDIWGKDLGAILGRAIRHRPRSIRDDVYVREVQDNTILYMDLFFISGLTFVLSISKGFNVMVVSYADDRKADSVEKSITNTIAQYAKFNVKVIRIITDGEGAIAKLKDVIEKQGIAVDQSSKNEHVAYIERAGRQLKERVRAYINTLPFRLTKEMVIYLVYYLVSMINSFPRSTSAIEGVSPKEKLTGRKLDYLVDCKLEFGDYCLANEDDTITNTMKARAIPAICLGPVGNIQGSYYFLNLQSWEVVKRRSWEKLPLPNDVIAKINGRADREAAIYSRGGLRFRIGETELLDSDNEDNPNNPNNPNPNPNDGGIAEVDYEPHYFQEEDSDEVNYESDYLHDEEADAVSHSPEGEISTHGYNLRKTPQRDMWREKYGLFFQHAVLSTYSITKGIEQYGQEAIDSMTKEMTQLHQKGVFRPVDYNKLTPMQKVRVIRSMMNLKRKRSGILKSRFLADGSMQLRNLSAIDPSSPTVSTEALFITAAIDAAEERFHATADIEGAFPHADMVGVWYVKVKKPIADILIKIDPRYAEFRLPDGDIILQLLKALYGCIESARLFYENISKVLLNFGFVKNVYDPCVFNKIMYEKQCTVTIHVDDLKISCVDSRGVDDVLNELKCVYGNINVHKEDVFDYLGMEFDYSKRGVVKISMKDMVEEVLDEIPVTKISRTPAAQHLRQIDETSKLLESEKKEKFHSMVAKLLYMAKRARPDILTAVQFLTTRVLNPTEQDWSKLERIVQYLKGTKDLVMHLSANKDMVTNLYIDASHACYPDMMSHTGVWDTLGRGTIIAQSVKQKLVTTSSCAAELVGTSDGIPIGLRVKNLIEGQGYETGPVILHQDNQSAIILEINGRSNSGRTRHLNIRYFFIKDQIDSGEVKVVYTKSEDMVADFFSKPLQGELFEKFRDIVLGIQH